MAWLRWLRALACLSVLAFGSIASGAAAQESGALLGSSGVVQIEGAGGGGLVPWAPITGYGTRDAIGATAHDSFVYLPDLRLNTTGVAIGLYKRLELYLRA